MTYMFSFSLSFMVKTNSASELDIWTSAYKYDKYTYTQAALFISQQIQMWWWLGAEVMREKLCANVFCVEVKSKK